MNEPKRAMRERTRGLFAALGLALLLAGQLFAALYIAHEADHDCAGDDCPICWHLEQCLAHLQLAGSGLPSSAAVVEAPRPLLGCAACLSALPSPITLVSLKVRMND